MKLAGDVKLGEVADMPEVYIAILWDLDILGKWEDRKFMKFNKGRCEVLQLGRTNPMHWFMLGDIQLESSLAEGDLGILVESKLKISQQCTLVRKKINGILGYTSENITSRWRDMILLLYSAVVRPHQYMASSGLLGTSKTWTY